jgi:hypothetical protein
MPAAADAVGPSPGVAIGGAGATWAGHASRFVALFGGQGTTLVERRGGATRLARRLPGRWGIPAVAYDGATEQVPPRSGVVVLAGRRASVRRTRFLVLSVRTLRPVREVVLRGPWAFDALSPDGGTMYLIEHPPTDLTRYDVRALDLRTGRLSGRVIADRRTGEWQMQGIPVARFQRPGGAWSYTLYEGGDGGAFVHALDTANATARCIDLRGLTGDLLGARLRQVGASLRIVDHGRRLAMIDTRTRTPVHATRVVPESATSSLSPWTVPALAGVVLAGAGAAVIGKRRRMSHNPPSDRLP